jgi:hypothetical protein
MQYFSNIARTIAFYKKVLMPAHKDFIAGLSVAAVKTYLEFSLDRNATCGTPYIKEVMTNSSNRKDKDSST